jgi:hypothetical protein
MINNGPHVVGTTAQIGGVTVQIRSLPSAELYTLVCRAVQTSYDGPREASTVVRLRAGSAVGVIVVSLIVAACSESAQQPESRSGGGSGRVVRGGGCQGSDTFQVESGVSRSAGSTPSDAVANFIDFGTMGPPGPLGDPVRNGYPVSGWHEESSTDEEAVFKSGKSELHVMKRPDDQWEVRSGVVCESP